MDMTGISVIIFMDFFARQRHLENSMKKEKG